MVSPLKWQTRVVSCFPAANGFAVGSIEGRVAIQYVPTSIFIGPPEPLGTNANLIYLVRYVEEKDSAYVIPLLRLESELTNTGCRNNFSFKCHRRDQSPTQKDQSLVYAVNDITFHPVHGTFSTCGSDGTINFWDKDARTRLKSTYPALRLHRPCILLY